MASRDLKLVSPQGDLAPDSAPFHNEGKTTAGWTLSIGLMIGSLITGIGVIAAIPAATIAGLVVCAASLVVSGALRAAGRGQPHVPAAPVTYTAGD